MHGRPQVVHASHHCFLMYVIQFKACVSLIFSIILSRCTFVTGPRAPLSPWKSSSTCRWVVGSRPRAWSRAKKYPQHSPDCPRCLERGLLTEGLEKLYIEMQACMLDCMQSGQQRTTTPLNSPAWPGWGTIACPSAKIKDAVWGLASSS